MDTLKKGIFVLFCGGRAMFCTNYFWKYLFFIVLTNLYPFFIQGYVTFSDIPLVLLETSDKRFSLSATRTWQEFNFNRKNIHLKDKKWIWTAMIRIRSKSVLKLQKVNLQWTGTKIKNLSASLYRKSGLIKKPILIEDFLVCDGTWNKEKQQISFLLDEKIISVNEYFLVLSIPKRYSQRLHQGQFVLAQKESIKLANL